MRRFMRQQRRSLCSSLEIWPPQLASSDILPRPKGLLGETEYYVKLLQECNGVEDLSKGKTVHDRLLSTGLQNGSYIGNNLVSMYSRCGSISEARRAFMEIKDRDVVTWNGMIAAFAQHGQCRQSFQVFYSMLLEGLIPSQATFVTVLTACNAQEHLTVGKLVHLISCQFGVVTNIVLATSLVIMYGKCGSLEEAVKVFEDIESKTVVSYNALVVVFTQRGLWKEAFFHFLRMQQEGIKATNVSFVNILNACSVPGASVSCGKLVHACLQQSEHILDAYVNSALISMYTRQGRLHEARKIFDETPHNKVSCNTIIAAYAEDEHDSKEAFSIFWRMQLEGLRCDKITFLAILSACASLQDGKKIHRYIRQTKFDLDVIVGTALMTMYGKCSSPESACKVFSRFMQYGNIVSWTAIITACAENGQCTGAMYYFRRLQQEGVFPNRVTFISLLNAFLSPAFLGVVKEVHALIVGHGMEDDVSVANVLVTSYGKCWSLADARLVFDRMKRPNIISWNAIMRIYVQMEQKCAALSLFRRMMLHGVLPDWVNFVTILRACDDPKDGQLRKQMHSWLTESGSLNHLTVQATLINMYGQAGEVEIAETLMENTEVQQDIVPWNSMISAYALHGLNGKAFQIFHRIHLEGHVRPDRVTFINMLHACTGITSARRVARLVYSNIQECGLERETGIVLALVNMYGSGNESLAKAREIFDKAELCNQVPWNTMLSVYARHGHVDEVLKLMTKMEQEGVKQDNISFTIVLSACSHAGYMTEAFQYFNSLSQERNMKQSEEHYACMIDLLAKVGKLEEAAEYACKMPSEAGWTSLLSAAKLHRDVNRGKLASKKLLDMDPLSSSACVVMHSIMRAPQYNIALH